MPANTAAHEFSYASVFFCKPSRALARFRALGPLFFFFKRAAARSVTVIFGALAMWASIALARWTTQHAVALLALSPTAERPLLETAGQHAA